MSALIALWLLLPPAPARADEPAEVEEGRAQRNLSDEELAAAMKSQLQSDPGVADSLAERINRSSLAPKISGAQDPQARLQEIRAWIDKDPDSAAGVAVGLAKDDAQGSHDFESLFSQTVATYHQFALDKKKGLFGRLQKSGMDSKLMKKGAQEGMADEEQREIIKTVFEGKGGMSNKILTQMEETGFGGGGKAQAAPSASSVFNSGYYDRLSQGNLRGYSPQLQSIQSALNSRRVPGAPKLIETGKLDYETLSYPGFSMRYDIENLERRLRYERNYAWARMLGRERELSPEQLLDPNVEARLKAQAAARGPLNPRFARRQAALERAAAAVRDFDVAALPSKDPLRITRQLLLTLGAKQKEAARWITSASLEEEVQRLEIEEGFLSPELLAMIARAPADEGSKAGYKRRGEEYKKNLLQLKSNDEAAIRALEADAWLAHIDSIERLLDSNSGLRKDLSRNIRDFVNTPYRLDALASRKPRWRQILDQCLARYLPSLPYSQGLRAASRQRDLLKDVFIKIATGDLDAAHTILASYEPGRPDAGRR